MEYLALVLFIVREISQFFLVSYGVYVGISVSVKLRSDQYDLTFIEAVRLCIEEYTAVVYYMFFSLLLRRNVFKHAVKVRIPDDKGGESLYAWLRNTVPNTRYKMGDYDCSELTDAIDSMDTNNLLPNINDLNTYVTIKFVRKQDAVLFKLAWG